MQTVYPSIRAKDKESILDKPSVPFWTQERNGKDAMTPVFALYCRKVCDSHNR